VTRHLHAPIFRTAFRKSAQARSAPSSRLNALHAATRARKLDVVASVKLDRLVRSVHHLVAMVREFEALGVDLVVLDQAIDTTTPSGRLLFHVLASISEFERDLIKDRVLAGLKRAKAQGVRLGRPRAVVDVPRAQAMLAEGQSLRQVAKALHVALATLARAVPTGSGRGLRMKAGL
jgi:DNA invertase Pin-like site-specific DNA recombinase